MWWPQWIVTGEHCNHWSMSRKIKIDNNSEAPLGLLPITTCSFLPKDNLCFDSYCFNVAILMKFDVSGIIQNIYSSRFFLYILFVDSIHVSCTYSLFIFVAIWYSTIWICYNVSDNTTADGHLGSCQRKTITNNAAVSILVLHCSQCTCMCTFVVYIQEGNFWL